MQRQAFRYFEADLLRPGRIDDEILLVPAPVVHDIARRYAAYLVSHSEDFADGGVTGRRWKGKPALAAGQTSELGSGAYQRITGAYKHIMRAQLPDVVVYPLSFDALRLGEENA